MAIKTSELTKLIADQVTKDVARKLVPKLRKVVREEFDRSMKDMIYEENIVDFAPERPQNASAAKSLIAQRQASRNKAKEIIERSMGKDDPFAELIMSAEDPQEELDLKEQQMMTQPLKDIKDISKTDQTLPENIDYSAAMERLFPQ